jgi:hypothetical protein
MLLQIPFPANSIRAVDVGKQTATWVFLAWVANAILLTGATAWIYFDGRSSQSLDIVQRELGIPSSMQITERPNAQMTAIIVNTLMLAAGVVSGTLITMLLGLFVGHARFRSLRAWLLFTLLVGGWLGLIVAGPEIYWLGQQRRMSAVLEPVESIARKLNANWPAEDGELPEIGPYLAYPKGGPTLVLPLRWTAFPDTKLRFSAIERTSDGVVRFELSGNESGAWLEWRADERAPESFKSGLETQYQVVRQTQLAPHWFLVRYRIATSAFDRRG